MSLRAEKVAQFIKETVSEILHDRIKDPRIGFLTITRVELTDDLRFARIFYSVLGSEEQKAQARQGLNSSLKFVKKLLGECLKIRYTPDIAFKFDDGAEQALRMEELFTRIEQERKAKEREADDPGKDRSDD
ncbi:MAG: 30S ribosome-binding factor RbfA [Candidatus Omnitrophica bacterium]|nr:30S ribosome-binding factor RbfA [Candidatus Omnitrophota bacterium]